MALFSVLGLIFCGNGGIAFAAFIIVVVASCLK
jgi:hypothetical protein